MVPHSIVDDDGHEPYLPIGKAGVAVSARALQGALLCPPLIQQVVPLPKHAPLALVAAYWSLSLLNLILIAVNWTYRSRLAGREKASLAVLVEAGSSFGCLLGLLILHEASVQLHQLGAAYAMHGLLLGSQQLLLRLHRAHALLGAYGGDFGDCLCCLFCPQVPTSMFAKYCWISTDCALPGLDIGAGLGMSLLEVRGTRAGSNALDGGGPVHGSAFLHLLLHAALPGLRRDG